MGQLIDLTGQRFGKLTVIKRVEDRKGQPYWLCHCDCGKDKEISGLNLRRRGTKSCGNCSHKHSKYNYHPTRAIWASMRRRCNNPNDKWFDHYGGRGIKVCEEWNNYDTFYQWAISHGWQQGLSLDRIDNDGSYSPDNCRWVDNYVQQNNRSYCIPKMLFNGELHTLKEISEITGINYHTLYGRIRQKGMSVEESINA